MHRHAHGAGGAPRQAQVLSAGRGMAARPFLSACLPAGLHSCHSCLQERQECCHPPARRQHLGLPGGAAGAMDRPLFLSLSILTGSKGLRV